MRKIFILLYCIVLAAQYSMVSAQKTTMEIWKGGSVIQRYKTDDVDSVTFKETAVSDNSKTINGHKFIDLGLPSGTLWAETNIGADLPADCGLYFAWGEKTFAWGENASGRDFSDYTNTYFQNDNYTKYNHLDGKKKLDAEDDAASMRWGLPCKTPTKENFEELIENCLWDLVTQKTSSGKERKGYMVTSKINKNSIFLPAAGGYEEEYFGNLDWCGYYWTNSITEDINEACRFRLEMRAGDGALTFDGDDRSELANSIRPVVDM